jgi:hypothetical protein
LGYNSGEPFDIQASRLNILVSKVKVIIDIIDTQLAKRAAGPVQ